MGRVFCSLPCPCLPTQGPQPATCSIRSKNKNLIAVGADCHREINRPLVTTVRHRRANCFPGRPFVRGAVDGRELFVRPDQSNKNCVISLLKVTLHREHNSLGHCPITNIRR